MILESFINMSLGLIIGAMGVFIALLIGDWISNKKKGEENE